MKSPQIYFDPSYLDPATGEPAIIIEKGEEITYTTLQHMCYAGLQRELTDLAFRALVEISL